MTEHTPSNAPIPKYIKAEVLDKIRAEIKVMSGDIETIADVLKIIDKYKAEIEPHESEEISDRNMKMWEEIFKTQI